MPRKIHSSVFRNHIQDWHPNPSKFENTLAIRLAKEAIREGDELRRKLEGRRILEAA